MKNHIIGFTLGILLVIVGVAELVPAMMDYGVNNPNYEDFLWCSLISMFFGGVLLFSNMNHRHSMTIKETFALTVMAWLVISVFVSLPYHFSSMHISFTDSVFEAVSGVTTTGSTVLSGLDSMSHGLLLWRSLSQWIGGIGIIAFAIVILPFLQIGGMQLFQTESSDRSEKVMAKTLDVIKAIVQVYVALTIACVLAYYILGMNGFDALNHALTTIPTGGYSTHDASFGFFTSSALQYTAAFFMFISGIPFVLYVRLLYKGETSIFRDEQVRAYCLIVAGVILVLTIWLTNNSQFGLMLSLQYAVFNVISVVTTTGFATTDYVIWGSFSASLFFFLTYLGGCTGSTSGGIKIMRLVITFKALKRQFKTLLYPNGVFTINHQGSAVTKDVSIAVLSFLAVFVTANVFLTLAFCFLGLDFDTAISSAATSLANVGPGISAEVGPAGNFANFPDAAKWLMCAGMIIGRLEIMTLLVMFQRQYWQP